MTLPAKPLQEQINHVALVLDASPSMQHLVPSVIAVADDYIRFLAEQSKAMGQETRVTVYMFADRSMITCLFYDKDVLRLPSLADHYRTFGGWTALRDAVAKSQLDLKATATLYGDHAFLTFILTDGGDNNSFTSDIELKRTLSAQGDNYTLAVLVPGFQEKMYCERWAPKGNVAIWDATSKQGMEEAGDMIRGATTSYMNSRAAGVTKTTGIFDMSNTVLNHNTIKALQEVTGFKVLAVKHAMPIREFIESKKMDFMQGHYFFPLVKREKVGPQKEVLVRHKMSGKIFGGSEVRDMLGLPAHEVSIKPGINDQYDIFIQSTSTNRNLVPGHDLLVKL